MRDIKPTDCISLIPVPPASPPPLVATARALRPPSFRQDISTNLTRIPRYNSTASSSATPFSSLPEATEADFIDADEPPTWSSGISAMLSSRGSPSFGGNTTLVDPPKSAKKSRRQWEKTIAVEPAVPEPPPDPSGNDPAGWRGGGTGKWEDSLKGSGSPVGAEFSEEEVGKQLAFIEGAFGRVESRV